MRQQLLRAILTVGSRRMLATARGDGLAALDPSIFPERHGFLKPILTALMVIVRLRLPEVLKFPM